MCRFDFVAKAKLYIKDVAEMSKRNQHTSSHQQQQQQQHQSQQTTERYNLLSSSIDDRSQRTVTSHVLKPLSVVFSFLFFLVYLKMYHHFFFLKSQLDFS